MLPLPANERRRAILKWLEKTSERPLTLSLVTPADAPFILKIRTDPERTKYLSHVSNDLDRQIEWIVAYQKRELAGNEFYFVIRYGQAPVGTVRLYDFQPASFSWGSWIILPGVSPRAALQSAGQVYEIGCDVLGYLQAHFEVRKENASVNRFHRRMGAELTGETEDSYLYRIDSQRAFKALT